MNKDCPDCHGEGVVKEKNGQIHTCWRCLQSGELEVHSDKVPDSKVRI